MRRTVLASAELALALSLARRWAAGGDTVTLVLLDAAASAARRGHVDADALVEAVGEGCVVLAHDDALRQRAIDDQRRAVEVKPVDLDEVADLVSDGSDRVVWL